MPSVHRINDICSGHGCFPPRAATSGASTVIVNNLKAHRTTDSYAIHCCGSTCHGGSGESGSGTVYIENLKCRRVGDTVSCGGVAVVGSSNVISG